MADDLNRESVDHEKTHHKEQTPAQPVGGEGLFVADLPFYPGTLLGDPMLNGRGNAPVRAALIQRMQQTYGNRAVQRLLRQQRPGSHASSGIDESREHTQVDAVSGGRFGRGVAGRLPGGLSAAIQTSRASSSNPLPVQREADGSGGGSQQQPQGDSQGQDQDKKKEPMSGELPPIKGEPLTVAGGCDDGEPVDGLPDPGSNIPARPLRFNAQLDMGSGVREGIDQFGQGAADSVNSSLTFGSTISSGGVTIPAGAFGYSQPTFSVDNIKWKSADDIITVNARIFVEVNWTVGAPGGQMNITGADDEAVVTENSWEKIVEDLTPDGTGKPKRDSYWVRNITVDHEKFHADEYITRAQGILPAAQSIVNRGDIPNHFWTDKVDITNEINRRIEEAKKWMESDVHTFYTSGGEERAYGAGKGAYETLVQAVKTRADTNKWKKKKPASATGAPAQRMTQVQRTPADPASQSSDADRQKAIDGD